MEHPETIYMLSPPAPPEELCLWQGFLRTSLKTPNARSQKLVLNSLEYLLRNAEKVLPVPSMISVVGSTSYEQGSPDAGPDSSSARAGRDTWLELSTCPEPRGCPFSKAPSSFGMESSPSVQSWKKAERQQRTVSKMQKEFTMKTASSISLLANEEAEPRSYTYAEDEAQSNVICISEIQQVQSKFWSCLTAVWRQSDSIALALRGYLRLRKDL